MMPCHLVRSCDECQALRNAEPMSMLGVVEAERDEARKALTDRMCERESAPCLVAKWNSLHKREIAELTHRWHTADNQRAEWMTRALHSEREVVSLTADRDRNKQALDLLSTLVHWHDRDVIDESWWDEARRITGKEKP